MTDETLRKLFIIGAVGGGLLLFLVVMPLITGAVLSRAFFGQDPTTAHIEKIENVRIEKASFRSEKIELPYVCATHMRALLEPERRKMSAADAVLLNQRNRASHSTFFWYKFKNRGMSINWTRPISAVIDRDLSGKELKFNVPVPKAPEIGFAGGAPAASDKKAVSPEAPQPESIFVKLPNKTEALSIPFSHKGFTVGRIATAPSYPFGFIAKCQSGTNKLASLIILDVLNGSLLGEIPAPKDVALHANLSLDAANDVLIVASDDLNNLLMVDLHGEAAIKKAAGTK